MMHTLFLLLSADEIVPVLVLGVLKEDSSGLFSLEMFHESPRPPGVVA